MDVLTEQEARIGVDAAASRLPLCVGAAVYGLVALVAILHHEAWADEAQSWLLARDATLVDLWTRLLHYEGTTGLWQTVLHGLIGLGIPYRGMNIFSGLLGLVGASILLWRAPFVLPVRLALPFTFFLCYQYAVIARSYSLLPVLLFCCATIYPRAAERAVLFTVLLCLLAAVSVHGMMLAMALGLSALISVPDRRRFGAPIACFAVVVLLLAAAARPASDGTFIAGLNFSFPHFIDVSSTAFTNAFTGEPISSWLLGALSIPLLWRGGGWLFFVLAGFSLCGIASIVYSQLWHHGVLFLAWLVGLWISWQRLGQTPKVDRLSHTLALTSLSIVVAVQCYWTACSIGYDWRNPYSGSLAAAQGLHDLNLDSKKLYAIGFACTAIEPYFPHNIFANVNDGHTEAYWDWSRRNHVNQDAQHLSESRPDYVIIGYKNELERGVWTDLVRNSRYRVLRHFEGNTFWQTRVLEPESYDLFERSSAP